MGQEVAKETGDSRGFGLGVKNLSGEVTLFRVKFESKGNVLKIGLGLRMS